MKDDPGNVAEMLQLLQFIIEDRLFALPLAVIDRMYQAVEVNPVPGDHKLFQGLVNIQGKVMPVLNLRVRMGLPAREVRPSDRLVVARAKKRTVAILVDDVLGVVSLSPDKLISGSGIDPDLGELEGVFVHGSSMVIVEDLERLFEKADKLMQLNGLEEGTTDNGVADQD